VIWTKATSWTLIISYDDQYCTYRLIKFTYIHDELDGPAVRALRRAIAKVKQHWSVIGWVTKNLLSRTPPCFGTRIKPLDRLQLQSLAPINPHWTRVVGYGPFSLCVIHKEGLCPSSRGINGLMMMMMTYIPLTFNPRRGKEIFFFCLYFVVTGSI
jgi:hypothetical protein